MLKLEASCLRAESMVLPHGSGLLPESPGVCGQALGICSHTCALGSLLPVLVPGWAAWGLLSMALWTNLMHGKVFFVFGGVFIPQKKQSM